MRSNATQANPTLLTVCLICMAAITQMGFVLYTPSFPLLSHFLHLTHNQVESTLSTYLLSFGIAQLIYGPLSDKYGRKPALLIGMGIFTLGSLIAIFSHSFAALNIARLIQGLGAGSCMTLSRAMNRDFFSGKQYIKVASYLASGFAIGLGLSPVIGGYLAQHFSWQATFIFLSVAGAVLLLLFYLFLPETRNPQASQTGKSANLFTHTRNILAKPRFSAYLVGGVLAYAVIISYTTMTPFLFQSTLHISASNYGWLTLTMAAVYYIGTMVTRKLIHHMSRLKLLLLGNLFILISGVLMLILAKAAALSLLIIFIPILIAVFGQAFVWSNAIAAALEDLSHIAGTAASIFGCLQMLLCALISYILTLPKSTSQLPIGITFIVLSVLSICIFSCLATKKK